MLERHRWVTSLRLAAIILVLTVAPPSRGGDSPATADLEPEARQLVRDLGSGIRATRQTAEKRLLELGPAVLPHLPPAELLPTVSVRAAVDRIRQELERRQARDSTQAARVTLRGTAPLEDWLARITDQTHNLFDDRSLPRDLRERSFDLDVSARDFWPVLDDLAARGGFEFTYGTLRRELKLTPRDPAIPQSSRALNYAGPFRLIALAASIVPLGQSKGSEDAPPRQQLARVVLFVQPEPRLRPLFLQYATAGITARAAKSASLKPYSPEASYELPATESGGQSRIQLDYILPPGESIDSLDLHGRFRMTTAAGSAAIRFAGIQNHPAGKDIGIERRRGGVTVSLQRIRVERTPAGQRELFVRVAVAYDSGGPAFESHRTWMLHNEVFLEGADKTRLSANGGYEMTLQADGAVGMEYRFTGLPDPLPAYSFVYVAPTLIVDVPVEFVLKSVPIPANASNRQNTRRNEEP
jgi:hypothetical protein